MRARFGRRLARLLPIIGAVIVIGGGIAYATIPDSGGVIHGCVAKGTGNLSVIDTEAGEACNAKQTPLDWNQTGPQGPPGPPGPGAEPQSFLVDCAAGETVNEALQAADTLGPLSITIKGTCTEFVGINRDQVTLRAFAPGDGLQAPSATGAVLSMNAARRVRLEGLTLSGGNAGLIANSGAFFVGEDLHITGASAGVNVGGNSVGHLDNLTIDDCPGEGISAGQNSSLGISGGTISGCQGSGAAAREGATISLGGGIAISDTNGPGVVAYEGAMITLQDGTISNSGHFGAFAFGGTIAVRGSDTLITGSTFSGLDASDGGQVSVVFGARISGNNTGISATNGGSVLIQDGGIVENNNGDGIALGSSSSLRMQADAIVRGNAGHGVHAAHTSVAQFGSPTNQIVDNGGWGVFCNGPPSVAMMSGDPGTVTGNAAGQLNCPQG